MLRLPDQDGGSAALATLLRDEWPRVLASLVRTTGSLQLAEDALGDAVVRAFEVWPRDGVPDEPRAWLTVVARRRAVDLLRREARRSEKEAGAGIFVNVDAPVPDASELRDDLLRLLFTCCHPALTVEAQTALALRTLCGLSTAEVASALLVPEATMAKRLVRAKRKITDAGIPYRVPPVEELPERLHGVLTTVYLLFNEGYLATSGDSPLRRQLTTEANRLSALLRELLPDQVSVIGLEALLRLHDARTPARLDAAGEPIRLSDQDRTLWNRSEIRAGLALLGTALRTSRDDPDPYVVQAAIAACHDVAPTWADTNWEAIVSWYDVLLRVAETPVVRLNRAVAIAELRGSAAGLRELDGVGELADYFPLVAVRTELLARAGRADEARSSLARAIDTPGNAAAKRDLSRRVHELLRTYM